MDVVLQKLGRKQIVVFGNNLLSHCFDLLYVFYLRIEFIILNKSNYDKSCISIILFFKLFSGYDFWATSIWVWASQSLGSLAKKGK